jgi:hypothetical protein
VPSTTKRELVLPPTVARALDSSDPRGPRKLMAVANPASTLHWAYRRLVNEATRDEGARYVHVSMRDNAEHLPADYLPDVVQDGIGHA